MRGREIIVFGLLLLVPTLGWAENRYGVSGSDGAYYQSDASPGGNVQILKNGLLHSNPGTNVFVQSIPAITRVGSTLYVVARSTDNNKIYCTRSSSPYTSWTPWVYVNGQTLDAPALVSKSGGSQAWVFMRGLNNLLYGANVTNCPSSPTWTAPGPTMQLAPVASSDPSGIYVDYWGADGEFYRWKQGTTSFPVTRWFGRDMDQVGGALHAHIEDDQSGSFSVPSGYAPPMTHRAVAIPPANTLNSPNTSGCPSGTPPGLALGGSLTAMCYVKDSSTGDFIIRNNMLSGGNTFSYFQYNWRSCMDGNSFGMFTDDCDFYTQTDWFHDIASPSSINLRAWASASGSPANQSGYLSLVFRLKNIAIPNNNGTPEIELHFLPYFYAQSGCQEVCGGHDADGRHVFGFTPACVGAQNLGSGQSRFYDVNLKSYILQRFGDNFKGCHADVDLDVSHWAITWGVGAQTVKAGTSQIITSVQHVALDVVF